MRQPWMPLRGGWWRPCPAKAGWRNRPSALGPSQLQMGVQPAVLSCPALPCPAHAELSPSRLAPAPSPQAGYNFLFGLWKYQWDADCELFLRILLVRGFTSHQAGMVADCCSTWATVLGVRQAACFCRSMLFAPGLPCRAR